MQGQTAKDLVIDTLLPPRAERFPWAGHLGLAMLPQVVNEIARSGSTLVFTNTRSQAELWYQALLDAKPDWAGEIALHHGSLDRAVREWVEAGLKSGALRAVVCTSSLDLGVDFLPVERVLQIGSPKGVARLLQRAGRSGHAPGRPSRVSIVPTHSLELIEGAAARHAVQAGQIEARDPPQQPLDVLVQHLVTVALGGGFVPDALYDEVRRTAAYADLSPEAWQWCLDFVSQGGASLSAYPDYHRAQPDAQGIWRVPDARLARRHRANIGTIVSDASMVVQYLGGAKLGTVEESFAARLKPRDCFLFGGRLLELVRVQDMTAWVKRASGKRPAVPRWNGGRMPLSTTLADAMVAQLEQVALGQIDSPELQAAAGHAHGATRMVGPAHAADAAGRGVRPRARARTCSSTRSLAAMCTWGWPACWPGAWRERPPGRFPSRSTTTVLSCSAPMRWTGPRCCPACSRPPPTTPRCCRRCWTA